MIKDIKQFALATSLGVTMTTQAFAEDTHNYTAALLYNECIQSESSVQRAHCNGFIHGFIIGVQTIAEATHQGALLCGGAIQSLGYDPSIAQLIIVFRIFIKLHPEALPLKAEVPLLAAFVNAFPCK
jgi:hypothetical protein